MTAPSHIDSNGDAHMVNTEDKIPTARAASARVTVQLNTEAFNTVKTDRNTKGNVLTVAKIAGIQAAKRTADLLPLCHQIPLDHVDLHFTLNDQAREVEIVSNVTCTSRTGVEMEALTACSVAALTVYDMLKAVQRDIDITDLMLISKTGGKSGEYRREDL